MKQAPTLELMNDITEIKTSGDLRRLISNSLLALARKEISATDVTALSKGLDAISASMDVEIKMIKMNLEMQKDGVEIAKIVEMGRVLIN